MVLTMFGGENGFVVDSLLHVGHQQVDVLRGRESSLLALLIHPQVLPKVNVNSIITFLQIDTQIL